MEGKNWWLMQTLPIENKVIFNSKILTHLSVVLPFYVVSVILSILALKPEPLGILWLILIPAAYYFIFFGCRYCHQSEISDTGLGK